MERKPKQEPNFSSCYTLKDNESINRILLAGSMVSGVRIGFDLDDPQKDSFESVPGVQRVKQQILNDLQTLLTGSIESHGKDHESLISPETRQILYNMQVDSSRLGFAYWNLAYESLVEQIWLTDNHAAALLMNTCRGNRPNLNHFAIANALLTGKLLAVYTTNFDELIEIAVQCLTKKAGQDRQYHWFDKKEHPSVFWQMEYGHRTIRVIKLHGTISNVKEDSEIGQIVCRYLDVARSLPDDVWSMLKKDLKDGELYVIGYSGSDLDIRGPLAKIAGQGELRKLIWYDYEGTSFHNCVNNARQRGRQRLLKRSGGIVKHTDLSTINDNVLLKWSDVREFYKTISLVHIEAQQELVSNFFQKWTRWNGLELLGRILDICHSDKAVDVLEYQCNLSTSFKYKLGRQLANSYKHAHRWKDYIRLVKRNPKEFGLSSLETKAEICFCRQMIMRKAVWTLPWCWLTHILLSFGIFRAQVEKKGNDDIEKEGFLYAKLIIIHFANRLLERLPYRGLLKGFTWCVIRPLFLGAGSHVTVKYARDVEEQYRRIGLLRRSIDTSREIAKAEMLFSNSETDQYETVRQTFTEIEEKTSIMGYEASAVNILRDLTKWAIRHNRLEHAEAYYKELYERNASSPFPEDIEKNNELYQKIEQLRQQLK